MTADDPTHVDAEVIGIERDARCDIVYRHLYALGQTEHGVERLASALTCIFGALDGFEWDADAVQAVGAVFTDDLECRFASPAEADAWAHGNATPGPLGPVEDARDDVPCEFCASEQSEPREPVYATCSYCGTEYEGTGDDCGACRLDDEQLATYCRKREGER